MTITDYIAQTQHHQYEQRIVLQNERTRIAAERRATIATTGHRAGLMERLFARLHIGTGHAVHS